MISHIDQMVGQDDKSTGYKISKQDRNQCRTLVGHEVFLCGIGRSGKYPVYAVNTAIGKAARARVKLVRVARKAPTMAVGLNFVMSYLQFLGF